MPDVNIDLVQLHEKYRRNLGTIEGAATAASNLVLAHVLVDFAAMISEFLNNVEVSTAMGQRFDEDGH